MAGDIIYFTQILTWVACGTGGRFVCSRDRQRVGEGGVAEGQGSAAAVGLQATSPSLSGRPRDLLVVSERLGSFKGCAGKQGSLVGFLGTVFLPSWGDEMRLGRL